jgi:hypothetical protein
MKEIVMPDSRRVERINHMGTAWLQYNGMKHYCQIQNVSPMGAMVLTKEPVMFPIPHNSRCNVKFYHDYDGLFTNEFCARVVYCNSATLGLEFIEMDFDSKKILKTVVEGDTKFYNGALNIIKIAKNFAEAKGIELSALHFDKGELDLEKEMHTLRLFADQYRIMLPLHRAEIEQFDSNHVDDHKIRKTVDKLHNLLNQ